MTCYCKRVIVPAFISSRRKELYEPPSSPSLQTATRQEETEKLVYQLITKALAQQGIVVITEEQEILAPLIDQSQPDPAQTQAGSPTTSTMDQQNRPEEPEHQDGAPEERDARLQQA